MNSSVLLPNNSLLFSNGIHDLLELVRAIVKFPGHHPECIVDSREKGLRLGEHVVVDVENFVLSSPLVLVVGIQCVFVVSKALVKASFKLGDWFCWALLTILDCFLCQIDVIARIVGIEKLLLGILQCLDAFEEGQGVLILVASDPQKANFMLVSRGVEFGDWHKLLPELSDVCVELGDVSKVDAVGNMLLLLAVVGHCRDSSTIPGTVCRVRVLVVTGKLLV